MSEFSTQSDTMHEFDAREERKKRLQSSISLEMKKILKYLSNPQVTDVTISHTGEIVIKEFGKGITYTGEYLSDDETKRIILLNATNVERAINFSDGYPTFEGVIPQCNARMTALLPPVVQHPELTIRKPPSQIYSLEDYVKSKRMSIDQYNFVVMTIRKKKNILIGGATGSGKTTFLNAVLKKMVEFAPDDKFYIVEDVPELQCEARNRTMVWIQPHQAVKAIRTALRWTVDRIIFGELRYGEVVHELLKAWNTGHEGNAATVHADSSESMIARLKELLTEVPQGKLTAPENSIYMCVHLYSKKGFGACVNDIKII